MVGRSRATNIAIRGYFTRRWQGALRLGGVDRKGKRRVWLRGGQAGDCGGGFVIGLSLQEASIALRCGPMSCPDHPDSPRIRRERKTIEKMVRLYCRKTHGSTNGLCGECRELLDFANVRLTKCPFQEGKPTCEKCPIHCYKPDRREQMKRVMRFSGPRMIWRHPIVAIRHLVDAHREAPEVSKRKGG